MTQYYKFPTQKSGNVLGNKFVESHKEWVYTGHSTTKARSCQHGFLTRIVSSGYWHDLQQHISSLRVLCYFHWSSGGCYWSRWWGKVTSNWGMLWRDGRSESRLLQISFSFVPRVLQIVWLFISNSGIARHCLRCLRSFYIFLGLSEIFMYVRN